MSIWAPIHIMNVSEETVLLPGAPAILKCHLYRCYVSVGQRRRCRRCPACLELWRGGRDPNGQISEYLDPTERYNYYDSAHDVLINTFNTCASSLYLYLSVVFRYYLICPLKWVLHPCKMTLYLKGKLWLIKLD